MKIAILNITELCEGNKRICLSSIRATNRCISCKSYDICESRRVNKPIHEKREILLKKMIKTKKQYDKFEEEFLKL